MINGQQAKDSKEFGGKSNLTRGAMETRAVQETNDVRLRNGNSEIRTTYGGIPVVDKNNKPIKGVKIQ